MNDNRHDERAPSAGADDRAPIAPGPDTRAPRVASRRYMLLKGATRGAAILAAATPIKTLAAIPSVTADGMVCTVSGIDSGVVSARTSLSICSGRGPSYYSDPTNWPNSSATYTADRRSFNPKTSFYKVFRGGTHRGLLEILQNEPNSDESHWIAAFLNATAAATHSVGPVFPYAPQEVVSLYAGPQRTQALAFFKGFMETL